MDKDLTETMLKLDKLRTNLYNEFKPTIKLLPSLDIDDTYRARVPHAPVATKKVTQVQMPYRPPPHLQSQLQRQRQPQPQPQSQLLPQSQPQSQPQQDNQPEILQEVGSGRLSLRTDLPPAGQLVKPVPDIGDIVFAMKHQLFPWTKGKVDIFIINLLIKCSSKK